MLRPAAVIRRSLGLALVALGLGAGFAACNANLETHCFDGECKEQEIPTTTEDTSGTTTTMCVASKNGSDACSDDPEDGDFPCEVFDVLTAKCHSCHTDPHASGAPIDLLTCNRFHEPECSVPRTRFRTADFYLFCTKYMPQGANLLTADEKQILKDWIGNCAPCVPAGDGCTGKASPKACNED